MAKRLGEKSQIKKKRNTNQQGLNTNQIKKLRGDLKKVFLG